jgi:hypothetical protein
MYDVSLVVMTASCLFLWVLTWILETKKSDSADYGEYGKQRQQSFCFYWPEISAQTKQSGEQECCQIGEICHVCSIFQDIFTSDVSCRCCRASVQLLWFTFSPCKILWSIIQSKFKNDVLNHQQKSFHFSATRMAWVFEFCPLCSLWSDFQRDVGSITLTGRICIVL